MSKIILCILYESYGNLKLSIEILVWLTRDQLFSVKKPPYGPKVLTQERNTIFYDKIFIFQGALFLQ